MILIPLCMAKEFRSRAMSILVLIGCWNKIHGIKWCGDLSHIDITPGLPMSNDVKDIYPIIESTMKALADMPDIAKGLERMVQEYMIKSFRPFDKSTCMSDFRNGNGLMPFHKSDDIVSKASGEVGIFQRKLISNPNEVKSSLDVIVVASLVEKFNNIGGICRTCEIFGCKTVTVSNLDALKDDKGFQALSMTADKWLDLQQVAVKELGDFLLSKKGQGYCLIGLEQTTHSVPLQDFEIPTKSIFVLGRERDGIPADLMQLLDYFVEIPQFGNVRSLNVHVSASILLWETRRRLINKK